MLCRLLGPVEVRAGESWTGVSAPKWRALLAVLALRPGQVVSTGHLAGELWSDDPPPGARKLVSGYVAALRRLAGDPDGRVLVTQAPGYRLMIASADLDVSRFEELVAAGRSALERADGARAAEFLAAALALWRGPALAGVPRGPLIAAEAARLDELQVDALELRAEAGICCGRAPELVAELRQLTAGHPLRERFWHQLMRALEHAGRPAQALEAYEQARKILAEELGADPGPDLQQLHRRLLAGDPAPAARPAAAPPPVAAIAPVAVQNHRPLGAPRQLPVSVRHFTGRDRELRTLQALLGGIDGDVGTVLIGIISGTAGVGKTTLAVHFAYQIAGQFPDGQLYVNLRGFDPSGIPVAPAEVIRGFLDALQVPPERIPALPDAQAAMYRSIMAGKRMLIVLDNARDAEQVRPLLPPSPGSLVLVTSRSQLLSLTVAEHACLLTVDLLTVSEARQLLALRLGEKTTRGNQQATDELITRCARLPLALSIVAARAAAEATQPLSNLAEQLRDIQERLDVLNAGDLATDIRAVFSCSYQSLSAPAARMFRLLGVHPGPDISVPAAASLSGLPVESARRILRELTSAHLLTERIPGRFAFHDLLRVYASEQVPDAERRPAIHRILDHYVYAGHTAALLIDPARRPLSLPPAQPGVSPQHHADLQQAVTWFQAERDVLLRVIGQAETAGFDAHAWQIPWTLASFLQQWGHWPDYIATQQAALAAAQHLGDLFREADTHYNLALAFGLAGLNDRAYAHMSRSLALHQQLSDPVELARSHTGLGWVLELQGRHAEALEHAQHALRLHQAAGHQAGQREALNAVGWYHALLGEYEQTLACCGEALTLEGGSRDLSGEAGTLDTLGYAHHHLGQYAEAIASYHRSLNLYRKQGGRHQTTTVLRHLGDSYRAIGDLSLARDAWQRALDILGDLRPADADQIHARLRDLEASGPRTLPGLGRNERSSAPALPRPHHPGKSYRAAGRIHGE